MPCTYNKLFSTIPTCLTILSTIQSQLNDLYSVLKHLFQQTWPLQTIFHWVDSDFSEIKFDNIIVYFVYIISMCSKWLINPWEPIHHLSLQLYLFILHLVMLKVLPLYPLTFSPSHFLFSLESATYLAVRLLHLSSSFIQPPFIP